MYVGEWKSEMLHGEGAYTFANGNEVVGEWKFGKTWNAVAYDSSGKVNHIYKNGLVYK